MTGPEIGPVLDRAAEVLSQEDLTQGIRLLAEGFESLPPERLNHPRHLVLRACIDEMHSAGPERLEYALLALHAVDSWLSG